MEFFGQLKTMLPEHCAEIDILENFTNSVADLSSEELTAEYTLEFNAIIEAAAIPKRSKDLIRQGASIGGNSAFLWTNGNTELSYVVN